MDEKDQIIQMYKDQIENNNRMHYDYAEKNDRINRRLIYCIIAVVGLLSAMFAFIAFTYFTADYYYPNITTENSTNTTNTIGGDK